LRVIVECSVALVLVFAFAGVFLVLSIGGASLSLFGGNEHTSPAFPQPGDTVTVGLTGQFYESTAGGPRTVKPNLRVDSGGVSHQWWRSFEVDAGSRSTVSSDFVQYHVAPITGERLSGPMPVTVGEDRRPTVTLTITNEANDAWSPEPEDVSFKIDVMSIHAEDVSFRVFPVNDWRHIRYWLVISGPLLAIGLVWSWLWWRGFLTPVS
jgi:hypothetical protein